jgi:polar amino acid transport system permease protein
VTDFFETLTAAAPRLWEATLVTLQLSVGGAAVAFVVAVVLGLASLSPSMLLRGTSRVVVEFFRGTSLVVQLFWLFFVLPQLGVDLPSMTTGILALGLNYGAYGSEVVRGSVNAVPKGQWETTVALSMSRVTTMRRVIWPQAWALMLPGFSNLTIMLIKGSALAGFIFLQDLTFVTEQLRRTTDTFVAFGIGMVIYYLIALAASSALRWLERRAQRRLGLAPPTRGERQRAQARSEGAGTAATSRATAGVAS